MTTLPLSTSQINAGQTFQDLLPASKAHARRGITWTPETGELVIFKSGKPTSYTLAEIYVPASFGTGRGFQLVKEDGTVYNLFVAEDRPHSTCDCAGHSYTGHCCHLDAIIDGLLYNRWLPDPRANAEADTGSTEVAERPERFETLPSGYVRQKGYETAEQTVF